MPKLRVVSLLPSATEILQLVSSHCEQPGSIDLVGRSHECDYPQGLEHLPVLTAAKTTFTNSEDVDRQVREALAAGTGLYTVYQDKLQKLKPDVIVTQSLCSVCSVDFCLVQNIAVGIEPPPLLVDLNPQNLQEVLADVQRVAGLLQQPAAGTAATAALQSRVDAAAAAAATSAPAQQRPSVAFVEWVAPIFVGGHWTPQLIEMAGGQHPLNPPKDGGGAGKSFVVTPQQLADSRPDWVIVAPCGLDLPTARRELESSLAQQPCWRELPAAQEGRVVLVDGNQMFNRPGPRLVDCLEFLVGLLHGKKELIPADFPYEFWQPAADAPVAAMAMAAEGAAAEGAAADAVAAGEGSGAAAAALGE